MQPEARRAEGMVAVVLAAQRAGTIDPLAASAGLTHKCLVPVAGQPMIAHVVAALRQAPQVERIRIVVEGFFAPTLRGQLPAAGAPLEFVASADNLADSVYAATRDLDRPTLLTTADNVLLTQEAVAQVDIAVRNGADVVFAMARRSDVLAAHPDGQRRFYRFTDDEYSNCNLYGFSGARSFRAAEMYRGGGQFAKKPGRLLAAIGVINLLLFMLGRLSLAGGMQRLSRRLRLNTVAVVLEDGAHAIDVDNERTYRVASQLLAQRMGSSGPTGAAALHAATG